LFKGGAAILADSQNGDIIVLSFGAKIWDRVEFLALTLLSRLSSGI
jgi:hypothetical protein